MNPQGTLIELHVTDFDTVKEFYQHLEFSIVWETPPEGKSGYLVMEQGSNVLCFWGGNDEIYSQSYFSQFPHDTKRGYGVEVILQVEDLKAYYERIRQHIPLVQPLRSRPWGLQEFRLTDPFGYYLRITEPHNVLLKR